MSDGAGAIAHESPLYGEQTVRALAAFGGRGRSLGDAPALIGNYARIKLAAARANREIGRLDSARAEAIVQACQEILAGRHDGQFPTPLVVGGGGTTTNANLNEVIAARASIIAHTTVHPNDHVNASQSSNDTYPCAMALTVIDLATEPIGAVAKLADACEAKGREYQGVYRLGRTCLQDAVSLTVEQTHRAQAAALRRVASGLAESTRELHALPLGGTVLGTGVGAPAGFSELCLRELRTATSKDLKIAPDLFDAMSHLDPYASIASATVRCALIIAQIAGELRFLAAGPIGGPHEVTLPFIQAGSSIMPGKVNPVVPELVIQLSYRIRGLSHAVEHAVAAGELDLNVMEPLVLDSLMQMFEDLTTAATSLDGHCITGLVWNEGRLRRNLEGRLDDWIAVSSTTGYDDASAQVVSNRAALQVGDE